MVRRSVLYLSYDGMTDPLGTSQVMPYLEGLSNNGFEFHLVSFEKPDRFVKGKEFIQKRLSASGIFWYPQEYTKRPPVFSTIYDLFKMWSIGKKISKKHKVYIVHCRSYPPAVVGRKLVRKFDSKFIFDIRGFWADERIEGGIWTNSGLYKLIYSFFKKEEKKAFETADTIVTLTHKSKSIIEDQFNVRKEVTVIPCAANLDLYKRSKLDVQQQLTIRNDLQIDTTDYVLCYLGSLGTWYMLEEMLLFFKALVDKVPNAKFIFYTQEPAEAIFSKSLELGIERKQLRIKSLEREQIPQYLSIVDSSVFFIKPCFSKQASSPTKHGELLAMEIPCVHNDIGDLEMIYNEFSTSVLCKEFDELSLSKAADDLLRKDFSQYSEAAEKYYSLDRGVQKYLDLYQSLC